MFFINVCIIEGKVGLLKINAKVLNTKSDRKKKKKKKEYIHTKAQTYTHTQANEQIADK